ncbi:multicopper oxidase family protein [Sorangium atrum]|uniref:Multicopper oxidase family protein n=1 Tax=Sorangium atrum TaxID=2995308 RepID=A0ABT5CB42_9BACT|nr:multicopper oxidase family protein [Sorangium aterium]MDC0683641.1 multicopper oxidase family protein [Sorangium aterium]MDC0684783.1 multicopper oxidase family protein [Sorangium aterium]
MARDDSHTLRRTGSLAALTLSLAALAGCGGGEETSTTSTTPRPTSTYEDPPELQPGADGAYELRFGPSEVEIDGRRFCLRAYNGMTSGPTIRIPKGEDRKVHVNLHNDFTKSDFREIASMMGHGSRSCHDFNLTNLHGHGLHVQPNFATDDPADPCEGDGCAPEGRYFGDHVLHEVGPGESARYRWDLDEDGIHHEGTDWYHPHIHGSTAIQVMDGAAGALLIEGALDELPGIAKARERVMVMTQVPIDHENTVPLKEGEECTEDNLSVTDFLAVESLRATLINGKLRPRLTTPPGQVERWRMVYAGSPDEMGMKLHVAKDDSCSDFDKTPIETTQIARDGLTLPQFYRSDTVWVSPGYRADVMVKMPEGKQTLCLVGRRPNDLLGSVIAIVDVDPGAGEPTEVNLPAEADVAALAPPTSWTGTVDGEQMEVSCDSVETVHQKVVLLVPTPGSKPPDLSSDVALMSCDPGEHPHEVDPDAPVCICPDPNISCRKFDERRARGYRSDRVMTAGSPERWEIRAFDGHPFHIHINPFLVCPNKSNKEPNFAHWRDTMWVQAEDGPRDVIMNPRRFTGQFVLHCHKLNHEDEGMMELVEICDPGDEECLCQGTDESGACISQAGCQPDDLACQFAKTATDAYPAPPPPNPELCGP